MFSDALDREAAWLATTNDSLPNLTANFDVIQARYPRVATRHARQLYVLRDPQRSAVDTRTTHQQTMLTTSFMIRLVWPIRDPGGSAENDQLAFEQAIDDVLTRIYGLVMDHTHGNRFLSVAEDPTRVTVQYADPAQVFEHKIGEYLAMIRYTADDFEQIN